MTKWVYSFGAGHNEGRAEMRNLLGGKGANLAEMASIGLPVPPGFTITTEVCTAFYHNERNYPDDLDAQVRRRTRPRSRRRWGCRFGDTHKPLLVSVRSGARVSMPGMMDTVLNLGLNDVTVEGSAQRRDDPRFAWDSYRRFIQMYGSRGARRRSPPVRGDHRAHQAGRRRHRGYRAHRARTGTAWSTELQGHGRGRDRQAVPAGPRGAALGRDRRGVRLLDEPPRHHLSPAARHPGRMGHRGQRAGHGVRQHGRGLRHRRVLHPRSLHRRERVLRRVPGERAGRGRGGRHPHAAAAVQGGRQAGRDAAGGGDAGGLCANC